ncbi:MAG: type II secretion system F family protein [Myxococcales bacterium]|nr:type II secretion system F family protein [Myxococcales bacterium]
MRTAPAHRLADRLALSLTGGPGPAPALRAFGHRAAADDVAAGVPLAEALQRHAVLSAPYLVAFQAGHPDAVRALVDAAARLDARRAVIRRATLAALGTLAGVLAAITLGAALAGPAFEARLALCGAAFPGAGAWAAVASPSASRPASSPSRSWPWPCRALAPVAGRRPVERAAARSMVAALVGAGVPLAAALEAAAAPLTGGLAGRLRRGAVRLQAGASPEEALATATLASPDLLAFCALAPAGEGGAFVALLHAAAALQEAEVEADAPLAGRGLRVGLALVAGAVVAAFAVSLVQAWVELLRCIA